MAKEYIEREALLRALNENNIPYNADVNYFITNAPAADVQEVVRCKDCKYRKYSDEATVNEKGFLICPASGMKITEYGFCSYGEKRECAGMTFDELEKYLGKKIKVTFENGDTRVGKLRLNGVGFYELNGKHEICAILAPSFITSISEVAE